MASGTVIVNVDARRLIAAGIAALRHLRWESAWREATGETWDAYQAKVEEGRLRYAAYHPPLARFDMTLDPRHAGLSRVTVTAGDVPVDLVSIEADVASSEDPRVTIRLPLWYADVRTAPRS